MPTFRKSALLCVIFGAHLLLFRLLSVSDNPRSTQMSEDALVTMMLVDLSRPNDTPSPTQSSSRRPISTDDLPVKRRVEPDSTITLPPEIEGADALVDWSAEASRVAGDAARRMDEKKEFRSLDQRPAGMGPLPPKSSRHKRGDSFHLEGGVIITWVGRGCYYSNQDEHIDAFGPALRLQRPTCTGAGGGGDEMALPTFEEWKKERDNR